METQKSNVFQNKNEHMNFEEFLNYEEKNEGYYEFDGIKPIKLNAPRPEHQEVSMRLSYCLFDLFKNTKCKVYSAPFALMYDYIEKGGKGKQKQPDVSVICDTEFYNNKYYGIPLIIFEILSPSNFKDDTEVKFKLYESLGVLEYVIINPYTKEFKVFNLDEDEKIYKDPTVYKGTEIFQSNIFDDLKIDLNFIFKDIVVSEDDIKVFKSKVKKVNFNYKLVK